jgi:diguanylate cyclase (GGDEF)-like protein
MNVLNDATLKTVNSDGTKDSLSISMIARDISFAYQPIIHMETGATHGVESLMRGHERLGFADINDVFDTVFRLGNLVEFEALLLQRAVSEFLKAGLPDSTRLFFNLDPRTIGAMDHVLSIVGPVLERHGMDRKRLCLEINERVDLDPAGDTARQLTEVRAEGIRIALDDFGTGFSRLKILHDQHADYVKFDRYFIDNVSKDPKKRVFLSNMLDMFHLLGVTTVAEGIETKTDLSTCHQLGFGLAQGYHIARPAIGLKHIKDVYELRAPPEPWARAGSSVVRGLMRSGRPGPPPILSSRSIKQALAAFRANPNTRVLPVVDDTGRPVGIIHDNELKNANRLADKSRKLLAPKSTNPLLGYLRACPVVDAGAAAETMLRAYATQENSSGVLLVENARFAGFLDPGSILRLLHERHLADASDQNHLTKLPGGGFIAAFTNRAIKERDTNWILIQFNFENFKAFNDTFGFQQGDRAIVMFADRLKRWYPGDSVMLGHGGGDSFTVGLENPDIASATTATYALRHAFAEDTSGFAAVHDRDADQTAPASAPPSLSCRAAMLLLKSGRTIRENESVPGHLSDLDLRAKVEGGFAFDRIG